jgi:hypothetical protein
MFRQNNSIMAGQYKIRLDKKSMMINKSGNNSNNSPNQ